MRVVIAGGHGKIALLLSALLIEQGYEPVGLIRNPQHAPELESAGITPLVLDMERATEGELTVALSGVDAVVFAAGAGPNSGPERKKTVDRDGAILLQKAASRAGAQRYLMVSAIGADEANPSSDEVFQIYLQAKADADASLRVSDLDWTIVRPGSLTDEPATGQVRVAAHTGHSSIPRADVAAVLAACLLEDSTIGQQFELVAGDTLITEALKSLSTQ